MLNNGQVTSPIHLARTFKRFVLVLCCLPLLGAAQLANVHINGISGDALINVQHRLEELYRTNAIEQETNDTLRAQVEQAIYPYGYFKPTVSITHHGEEIRIHIAPGPALLIGKITLLIKGEGAHNHDVENAAKNLPIHEGDPLNTIQYEQAKEDLTTAAENQGYLHEAFETAEIAVDKQHNRATITLIFNTGPQYYFGQIRFAPTYLSPDLLRRYARFHSGLPYSTENVLAFNNDLSNSGYFSNVNVKPAIGPTRFVPIDVNLQPTKRVNYSLGVGYGTDTGPRGKAGVQIVPVNRSGHKFNAVVQGSFIENALQAQYLIPGQNPVTDKYSINGGYTNLHYTSGNSNSFLATIAKQHALSNYQQVLSINGLTERYNYTYTPKTGKSLMYPKAIFSWNHTSDPLFSPSGYNITLSGLVANRAILSQVNLGIASIDAKAAFTIEPLRTRLYMHTTQSITAINNISNLPLSLAQLLGGANNLKGYSYNSIGPGRRLSYAGVELQKETFKKWYAVGSFDAGSVYNPGPRSFLYDVGLGLMWVSPVGPIKIGLAEGLDHRWRGAPRRTPKLVVNMGTDL